jgi:hypothetical protein
MTSDIARAEPEWHRRLRLERAFTANHPQAHAVSSVLGGALTELHRARRVAGSSRWPSLLYTTIACIAEWQAVGGHGFSWRRAVGRLAAPYTPRLRLLSTTARDLTPVRQDPKEQHAPKVASISPKRA